MGSYLLGSNRLLRLALVCSMSDHVQGSISCSVHLGVIFVGFWVGLDTHFIWSNDRLFAQRLLDLLLFLLIMFRYLFLLLGLFAVHLVS